MDKGKKERDKAEKEKAEYDEGLKKTLTPVIFGIIAGVICYSIFVFTPYMVVENGVAIDNLDNGIVPDNLLNMFEDKDTPLSENVTVKKAGTDKWLIKDEGNKNSYIIKKNTEKMSIYATPISTDWLLIAILIVMLQKFAYPMMHTSLEGPKDWIYISFMTLFCWFMSFTLLLSVLF